MKNLFFTLLAIGTMFNSIDGFCRQTTNFTETKNVGTQELISKYKDGKVLFVRHDSTFIAELDDEGQLQNITYTTDLKKIEHDGQVSYGSKSGALYYTQSGKLFTARQKKNGQWVEDKYIEIPGFDIKRDKYKGSVLAYANWRYLPNDSIVILNPAVNDDETVMYFATNNKSKNGLDIWKVDKIANDMWGNPQKLGANINSNSNEDYPFVREDGSITFASDRKVNKTVPDSGKYNVYVINPKNEKTPQLLSITPKVKKEEPKEDKTLAESIQKIEETIANNQVVAQETKEPEQTTVQPEEKKSEDLNSKIENALNQRNSTSTDKKMEVSALNKTLEAHPDTVIQVSKNVLATHEMRIFYFEFDKGIPNGTYKEDLEIVLDFINAYPNSQFLLVGHTDERGTFEYNDKLSMKRAEWVYFNLLLRGVKVDRLKMRGDGEYHPIIKNAKTEEDHQKNRRVEIYKLN
ncbi:MAG: OmpA family protein [Paludibacteraceae bacterium]|nr:OmpA family protein [Paludibacteraceae bacterium]